MGLLPSVTRKPFKPKPLSSLACISGPARAISSMVSRPMASTWDWNRFSSTSISARAFSTSRAFMRSACAASASRSARASPSRDRASIAAASASSFACFTSARAAMSSASARARASLAAWPSEVMAALSARRPRRALRAASFSASLRSRCCSSSPLASSSSAPAWWRARASCELVVISMAICTLLLRLARVASSTGSTLWMSMLVISSRLAVKVSVAPSSSSKFLPNTARRMILAEFLWKLSKVSPATAPRTREAMLLITSPTKSRTLNTLGPSRSRSSTLKRQL
mmetsp:Transcript_28188/g.41896  ORF Transcript_28188/g.41896 Transcript_28188/m.41896 type:complete len:285 (+) Transcript_28188:301-1155(+)